MSTTHVLLTWLNQPINLSEISTNKINLAAPSTQVNKVCREMTWNYGQNLHNTWNTAHWYLLNNYINFCFLEICQKQYLCIVFRHTFSNFKQATVTSPSKSALDYLPWARLSFGYTSSVYVTLLERFPRCHCAAQYTSIYGCPPYWWERIGHPNGIYA